MTRPFRVSALTIFIGALAVRWVYSLSLYYSLGEQGLMGPDSNAYVMVARNFAAGVEAGTISGWVWLGTHILVTPFFNWLIGFHAWLSPNLFPVNYVLMQGLTDAGTCVLIFATARLIDEEIAIPAGVLAAINPTQVVMSGLVYADTTFVFFIALSFFGVARWLKFHSLSDAALIAIGLAGAAGLRVLIVPWIAVLIAVLAITVLVRSGVNRRLVTSLAMMSVMPAMSAGLAGMKNYGQYGQWALTTQSGIHLSGWVVPLVKEAKDRTPWATTFDEMEQRTRARFGPLPNNAVEQSRQYTVIGREALAELGPMAIAKAWGMGAAINMSAPAIILSPPVITIPRTGFYATPGETTAGKIFNFLFRSESAIYTWALLTGAVGVGIIRLFQIGGTIRLIRQGRYAMVLIFAIWILYILTVTGPVASPKYRLPLEPVLMILAGAGWAAIRTKLRGRDQARAAPAARSRYHA